MAEEFTRTVETSQPGNYTAREFTARAWIRMISNVDKETYKHELGVRLKQARKNAGLSLQAAASELIYRERSESQAYPSRIGNYEQGVNVPDAYTLHLLCEIYDCDATWLHEGVGNNRLTQINDIWRKTDERGRDAIFSNARAQPIEDKRLDQGKKSA